MDRELNRRTFIKVPLPSHLKAAQEHGIENFYEVTNDPEP
jgi:hypothetical protein